MLSARSKNVLAEMLDNLAIASGDVDVARAHRALRQHRPGRKLVDGDFQHLCAAKSLQMRTGMSENAALLHEAKSVAAHGKTKPESFVRRWRRKLREIEKDPVALKKLDTQVLSKGAGR